MTRLFVLSTALFLAACGSNDDKDKPKQEEWLLTERRQYEYRLNEIGNPDTTFVHVHRYKSGVATDSLTTFYVNKYKGNFLTEKTLYRFAPDKKSVDALYTTYYDYDNSGRLLSTRYDVKGKLYKSETYTYDTRKQPIRTLLIQQRGVGQLPDEANNSAATAASNQAPVYDTVIGTYSFDTAQRVLGTVYTDGRGNLLRRDMNVYSGNDPLRSISLGPKGDTIQRIGYEKSGKTLHTKLENDSFILYQNMIGPIQTGQLTVFKKSNEKWKTSASFDFKGRRTEEKVYKVGFAE